VPSWSILGFEVYIPDLNEIISAVTTPITSLVTSAVAGLSQTVMPVLNGLSSTLGGLASSIVTTVTTIFNDALGFITTTITGVASSLAALGPQILSFFQTTWTQLTTFTGGLWTNISNGLNTVQLTVGGLLEGARVSLLNSLDTVKVSLAQSFTDGLNLVGSSLGGLFAGFGIIDVAESLRAVSNVSGTLWGVLSSLPHVFSPLTPEEARAWVDPFLVNVDAAVGALHVANLIAEGVSLGQVDVSLAEAWKYPATAAAVDLATEFFGMPIREGLMPVFKRYVLASYQPNIPSYADMIRIYVKEAYLSEKWTELPNEFAQNMRELGYPSYWTQRLWGAHWELVSVRDLYEMYHRTLGTRPDIGVTLDVLRTMLKYHDYEPDWRDRLEAITWRTWRIFDLRTAWEMNIIDDAGLESRSVDTGYSPEEAPLVAQTQKMFVLRSEIDNLLKESDNDFIDGFITLEQLKVNYNATPFRPELRDMRVARAKLRHDRDLKKDWASVLRTHALRGSISPETFGEELSKLGMVQDRVSEMVEDVRVRRTALLKVEAVEELKLLPESSYSRAYRVGLIPETTYKVKLAALRYSEDDVALLVSLNAPEKPTPEEIPTLTASELKSAFRVGVLTEDGFRAELARRLYSPEDIDVIVETEKKKIKPAAETPA